MEVIKLSTMYGPLQSFLTQSGGLITLILGASLYLNHQITAGAVVGVFALYSYLYSPIQDIVSIYSNYSQVQDIISPNQFYFTE